jgi:hypothetical protein
MRLLAQVERHGPEQTGTSADVGAAIPRHYFKPRRGATLASNAATITVPRLHVHRAVDRASSLQDLAASVNLLETNQVDADHGHTLSPRTASATMLFVD